MSLTVTPRQRSVVRVYVATVGLLSMLVAPAYAQQSTTSHIAIDNFGRVNANYFRGAQPAGRDYADLAALGVHAVVDLTGSDAQPDEAAMTAAAGMHYFHIPMTTHTAPTPSQIAQFLAIVNDPANEPVYVHCVGGSHRTGVMTAVYRMTHDQWAAARAFAEMRTFKFGPEFLHAEFKKFVLGYQVVAPTTAAAAAVR
jgi:protein tyrosine/serine phosphatase